MSVTPAMANPAASLSIAGAARTGSATQDDSALAGGGGLIGVAAFVVVVVAFAIIGTEAADDSDSN